MAGLTLQHCENQLAFWLEASEKVAQRQSWQVNGRTFTAADAGQIRENIDYWDRKCRELSRPGPRVRGAKPL